MAKKPKSLRLIKRAPLNKEVIHKVKCEECGDGKNCQYVKDRQLNNFDMAFCEKHYITLYSKKTEYVG